MLKITKKNLFIVLLLVVAGSLQADIIKYSDSVVMQNDVDATVNLPQFDSSLGTLTGVYLKYSTGISGVVVEMDNDDTIAANGTARATVTLSIFTSSLNLWGQIELGDLQVTESQLFELGATTGGDDDPINEVNNTGNSDYAIWAPEILEGIGEANIVAFAMDQYIGAGTVDLTINAIFVTSATMDGSNSKFNGSTPSGEFSGDVIYTYDAVVPEPAAIGLIGLGGILTLVISRIKRHKA